MNKIVLRSFSLSFLFLLAHSFLTAQDKKDPAQLRLGYSIRVDSVTPEKMRYAKSAGIDYIETSLGAFIDKKTGAFNLSDEEIIEKVKQAKKAADDAGIQIWSIHMPFSRIIDLSLTDEGERREVIALQKKTLGFCRILQPKIILFHPSWHLKLNQREARKQQLIKSATELNEVVKDMNATMVIENMLGPELYLPNGKLERPLCRTVEETVEIMNRLPRDIYSAVDMNHIKNPENLIRAMGSRLKSVHIADGDGEAERHYFPCSGKGANNWTAILAALHEADYNGPFMFESKYEDVKDFKECYDSLYANFVQTLK